MEVRDATNGVVVALQGSHEISDVIAIALHLKQRMLDLAVHPLDHDKAFVAPVQLGLTPLLELDDHVGIGASALVDAPSTTSERLLVSGSWYSISISIPPRPASTRSRANTGRLRRQDFRSDSEGERPVVTRR